MWLSNLLMMKFNQETRTNLEIYLFIKHCLNCYQKKKWPCTRHSGSTRHDVVVDKILLYTRIVYK
jgi:hypothetical protein